MKEKHKGHSRRRLVWLLGVLVFLLGGYFSLPYAQNAVVGWWEDDPFTPICDVPEYEIYRPFLYTQSKLSTISPNPVETIFPHHGRLSPNRRWLQFESYNPVQSQIYDISTNTTNYTYNLNDNWQLGGSFWLYDNKLLYRQAIENSNQQTWFLYNVETEALQSLPQTVLDGSYPLSYRQLTGNNYFLATESVQLNEGCA
jgi:hypothetical protein